MTRAPEPNGLQRMSGWKIALLISLAIILVMAVTAWYLVWQGGLHTKLAHADLSAIEAQNSTSSSMSSSRFNDARMEWSRIAVIDESEHAFGKRITQLLTEDLKQMPGVKEVVRDVQQGQQLPSLTIRVSLPEFSESNTLIKRKIDAKIHFEMENVPKTRAPGYSSSYDPPLMDIQSKADQTHQSQSVGDGLGAEKYRLSAKDAESQIAKHIRDQIDSWQKDPGELFDLPPVFFGPFVPVKDVSAITARKMKCLSSGYRMMVHNESVYEWSETGDPQEIIKSVADEIAKEGWRQTDISPEKKDKVFSQVYARLMRDDRRVTISCETDDRMNADDPTLKTRQDRYRLHYQHQFSTAEKAAAIQKLIDARDMKKVMHFYHCMQPEQRDKMDAWLEAHPTVNLRATISALWRYRDNPTKAKSLLRKYNMLARLNPSDDTRSLREEEAKKLGIKLEYDHEALKETDLLEVGAIKLDGQEKIVQTIEMDAPLITYRIKPNGKIEALCVKLTQKSNHLFLDISAAEAGGQSWMSAGFDGRVGKRMAQGDEAGHHIEAEITEDGKPCRVTITRMPPS